MDPLYELSKLYADKRLTKEQYRDKRRTLLEAILSGKEPTEYSATLVPSTECEQEITQQPTINKPARSERKTADERLRKSTPAESRKSNKLLWLFTLLIVLCGGVYAYSVYSKKSLEALYNEAHTLVKSISYKNGDNENTSLEQLTLLWDVILTEQKISEVHQKQLQALWAKAPEDVRLRFENKLREAVELWETNFDKEIESGLTKQILDTIGLS